MQQVPTDSSTVSDLLRLALDSLLPTAQRSAQAIDSLHASVERLAEVGSRASPWDVGSSLAAIVVAILAGIELYRLYQYRREGLRRASAKVSAVAIPLHRSIASWLDEMPADIRELVEREHAGTPWSTLDADGARCAWLYWTLKSAKSHIGKTEARVEALNAEAPFAYPGVRLKVIRATASFYGAFDHLNLVLGMPWADDELTAHPPQPRHRTLIARGHAELDRCREELKGLIDKEFKKAAIE